MLESRVDVTKQLEEMRKVATKQNAQAAKSKDDCSDLRATITNIRDKINNLETQVIGIKLSAVPANYQSSCCRHLTRRCLDFARTRFTFMAPVFNALPRNVVVVLVSYSKLLKSSNIFGCLLLFMAFWRMRSPAIQNAEDCSFCFDVSNYTCSF